MRTLSSAAIEAVLSPESGHHLLWIAQIDHPEFDAPIRIANSLIDILHGGNTYTGVGFSFTEPADDEDGIRAGEIAIGNADRALTPYIRGADYRLTITIKLVSVTNAGSTPPVYNTTEIAYPALALEDITIDNTTLRAAVKPERYQNEPWPADTFNPYDFRSL